MSMIEKLPPSALRWTFDELDLVSEALQHKRSRKSGRFGALAQDRALSALELGLGIGSFSNQSLSLRRLIGFHCFDSLFAAFQICESAITFFGLIMLFAHIVFTTRRRCDFV